MCWTTTLKMMTSLRLIDVSSRQVVHIHAMADQQIRCQFQVIQVAAIESVLFTLHPIGSPATVVELEESGRSCNLPIDQVAANHMQARTAAQSMLPPT
jgi:hypothetical protein